MKKIEIFERAIKEGGSLKDYGINATVFAAYRNLEYTGNEDLDFADTIWDHDIAEITETLRGKRNQGIYDKQHLFRTHRNTCSF